MISTDSNRPSDYSAETALTAVAVLVEHPVELTHPSGEIPVRRLDQDVIVVGVMSLAPLGVPGGYIPRSVRTDLENFPRRFRHRSGKR